MSTANTLNNEMMIKPIAKGSDHYINKPALVLSRDNFTKINILNNLNTYYQFQVMTKDNIEDALKFSTEKVPSILIVDIDDLPGDSVRRIYKLISHLQIPCLLTSSNIDILNHLKDEMEETFISFLPKAILNSMFNETVKLLLNKTNPAHKISVRLQEAAKSKRSTTTYLLAALLFLEPVFKIFYLKMKTNFEFDILFRTIMSMEGVFANFEFWLLFPLAGFALLSVRTWSFFFFIALQIYTMISFFTYEQFTWPYVEQTPHVSNTLLLIFNSALVFYFLTPEHIRPFWNKTRRIWRDTARFAASVTAIVEDNGEKIETRISNISESGAYFTTKNVHPIGHRMNLEIDLNGKTKKLNAVIRRVQPTAHENFNGYGIEFIGINKKDKKEIKDFVLTLSTRLQ